MGNNNSNDLDAKIAAVVIITVKQIIANLNLNQYHQSQSVSSSVSATLIKSFKSEEIEFFDSELNIKEDNVIINNYKKQF